MIHKNGEGYPDYTAADAIRSADKPPEIIRWYIRMVRELTFRRLPERKSI